MNKFLLDIETRKHSKEITQEERKFWRVPNYLPDYEENMEKLEKIVDLRADIPPIRAMFLWGKIRYKGNYNFLPDMVVVDYKDGELNSKAFDEVYACSAGACYSFWGSEIFKKDGSLKSAKKLNKELHRIITSALDNDCDYWHVLCAIRSVFPFFEIMKGEKNNG